MKNKIIYMVSLVVLAVAGLSGCKDETTAGFTGMTFYPTLEVLGDPVVLVDKGANYIDAGCYAELKGEDVTDQVEINSTVDTNVAGIYSVSFRITNEDGFSVTGSRTVYVADPTPSIITSGVHIIASGTHRINHDAGDARTNYSGYSIIIIQTEPGTFYVSDFFGGYYDQRLGYGSNYAMTGYFKLNSDNTLSLVSSHVIGWGDSLDGMYTGASVDPGTGTISWSVSYAGILDFNVIIN